MTELNDEKLKMMEDEMNRFEEEIGLPNLPLPPSPPLPTSLPPQPVIGANTFSQVQAQLRKIENEVDIIPPPPPPPPPMFVPHQVQRMGHPMDMQMNGGPPPMPFGPPRGFPMPGPMGYGPPMNHMPPMGGPEGQRPMGQGHMGPGPMGNMGPGGPMGPGPMGPGPMGPGPMGQMGPRSMGPGPMSGPGPMMNPGPMMGPRPMMGPGSMGRPPGGPMMLGGPGFIPPPPEFVQAKVQQTQGPVVLSGAPKKYNASGTEEPVRAVTVGPEYPPELAEQLPEEKKLTKKQKLNAKEMAEKVKATAVVSIVHEPGQQQQAQPNTKKKDKKNKKLVRTAGGQTWEDTSLTEWEEDDFRLFCGDLGNDVTDEVLTRAFSKYASFLKAKVVRDKRTNKTKGFGFVSFKDPQDFIKATKEMNGRYVGSRPIKLRKSTWRNRSLDVVRKKEKEKATLIGLLTGRT